LTRDVELEGPLIFEDLKEITHGGEVYTLWFDCDCGRRMPIRASPSGLFQITPTKNIWKLEIKGNTLSTTPSILFEHPADTQGRPAGTCHLFITNEPFTKTTTPRMQPKDL
jgi:hypothetical protein